MIDNENEAKNLAETVTVSWQKKLIDERLDDYYHNPTDIMDFDKTINDIERSL
jgi:hypothetical protein